MPVLEAKRVNRQTVRIIATARRQLLARARKDLRTAVRRELQSILVPKLIVPMSLQFMAFCKNHPGVVLSVRPFIEGEQSRALVCTIPGMSSPVEIEMSEGKRGLFRGVLSCLGIGALREQSAEFEIVNTPPRLVLAYPKPAA
jgi:hypothetical protein